MATLRNTKAQPRDARLVGWCNVHQDWYIVHQGTDALCIVRPKKLLKLAEIQVGTEDA